MKKLILIIVAVMMAVTTMATSLTDGLVGYWPFDGDAKDYSGNGNHGATHGVTQTTDRHGKAYSAYHFNGSSYISVAANGQLNAIGDFTVATWINADAWHTYWIPIVCKGEQFKLELINENCPTITSMWESGEYDNSFIGYDDNYKSIFGAGCFLCTSHRIPLKEWLHVAVSRSGKTIRAYINGALVDSGMARNAYEMNSSAMDIGRDLPGSVEYLYGRIDDMYLYNRALSASEVKALYNGMLKVFTVAFNANDGEGTMSSLSALSGTTKSLPTNMFHRDGYVFKGWAKSTEHAANGIVDYTDEQEITVDSDMTLYAVWANPALALAAESADWSLGSITLRCEDSDTSGTVEPFYDLMYFDDKMDEWRVIDRDDLSIPSPVVETNSDGVRVRVTRITDMKFSKRNNGVGTVQYRVVDDENSMRTAKCVTRSRHGLFVVLDEYENGDRIPTAMHEASVFREAYLKYGNANGYISTMNGSNARKADVLTRLEDVAEKKVNTGDIFVLYYMGHGGDHHITCYGKPDYGKYEELYASELTNRLHKLPAGVGAVVILNSCQSASMISREDVADGMGSIGWIVAAHTNQYAKLHAFTQCICHDGWFFGKADVRNEDIGTYGNDDGFVTFDELAFYGQQWSAFNNAGQIVSFYNSTLLENIVAGRVPTSDKSDRTWIWSTSYPSVFVASGGDIATAAAMMAANGCRTVGECYELGIDPEDPNDDLKIAEFKMKDGKPVVTLNHMKDGSGNSFEDRVKILGKAELTDAEWQEVPPEGNPAHRFFKVGVEMP